MFEDKNDKINLEYKIITLGDCSVGKTSIIKRYITDTFDEDTAPTLGITHSFKILEVGHDSKIKLSIIDTNGQEKYKSLSVSYFRHADVVLFIFNLNEPKSFINIQEWINTYNKNNEKRAILRYLIGNKSDLEQRVEQNLIDEFTIKNDMQYITTSAKSNSQINELFQQVGEELFMEEKKKLNTTIKKKSSFRIHYTKNIKKKRK